LLTTSGARCRDEQAGWQEPRERPARDGGRGGRDQRSEPDAGGGGPGDGAALVDGATHGAGVVDGVVPGVDRGANEALSRVGCGWE
jgi:hypothetical protein